MQSLYIWESVLFLDTQYLYNSYIVVILLWFSLSLSLSFSLSLSLTPYCVSLSLFPSYCGSLSVFPSYCVSLSLFPSYCVSLSLCITFFLFSVSFSISASFSIFFPSYCFCPCLLKKMSFKGKFTNSKKIALFIKYK